MSFTQFQENRQKIIQKLPTIEMHTTVSGTITKKVKLTLWLQQMNFTKK